MHPVDQAEQLIGQGGHVHLLGIGGIGMAGLAWLLKEREFQVSGCDLQCNRQTEWLIRNGVEIQSGHAAGHINDSVDWVIRSTAITEYHPEVVQARALKIPVSRRGEVLPALMRDRTCIAVCGTHGKTTTTAMIAQVLDGGYYIGGEIADSEAVAKDAPLMVVEADESDGTLTGYTPDYTVITNVEYDHMEHHASEKAFIDCFKQLIQKTKQKVFYRADDPIVKQVVQTFQFGQEQAGKPAPQALESFSYPESKLVLPLPGNHNQWNAAATIAVCREWKSEAEILSALEIMKPVRRRFETVFQGKGIQIISDYAHHPTEISALVQTALELRPKRLLGIFQPHRYTRTRALGLDFPISFEGLDKLWLVPVYAASESPVDGGTTEDLIKRFSDNWKNRLFSCPSLESAWRDVQSENREGDLLLIIGAGDIEQMAEWAREI